MKAKAKIAPQTTPPLVPFFARRKPSAAFKQLDNSGKTGRGTDSTVTISEDRQDGLQPSEFSL